MHSDMTDLALKWYPELAGLINTYDLKIKLDPWGYGKCFFYKGEEVGYFYEFGKGVSLHFVKNYGIEADVCDDFAELAIRIEAVLNSKETRI